MHFYFPKPKELEPQPIQKATGRRLNSTALAHRRTLRKRIPSLRRQLSKLFRSAGKNVNRAAIERAIRLGRVENFDDITDFAELEELLQDVKQPLKTTVLEAAADATTRLPTVIKPDFAFDTLHPRLDKWIDDSGSLLVQNVTDKAKSAIDAAVRESFTRNVHPNTAAKIIQGSIGVDDRQAISLVKFQEKLEQRGIKGDKLLNMVSKKSDEYIADRSRRIARTEIQNALNEGHKQTWQQVSDEGLVDLPKTKKRWRTFIQDDSAQGCIDNDGLVIDFDAQWPWTDYKGIVRMLDIPSESHPNCNCIFEVIPALPDGM